MVMRLLVRPDARMASSLRIDGWLCLGLILVGGYGCPFFISAYRFGSTDPWASSTE